MFLLQRLGLDDASRLPRPFRACCIPSGYGSHCVRTLPAGDVGFTSGRRVKGSWNKCGGGLPRFMPRKPLDHFWNDQRLWLRVGGGLPPTLCHVANADGGEAMLFDRSGAARSAARTRFCLIGLPEGEGCAFTLTTEGVWLAQIRSVRM